MSDDKVWTPSWGVVFLAGLALWLCWLPIQAYQQSQARKEAEHKIAVTQCVIMTLPEYRTHAVVRQCEALYGEDA